MPRDETKDSNPKKVRKRVKGLYRQIREQMEFYFSDANLQKDRFFMQLMKNSTDGYIDLDVFLQCNKIRSMTSDIMVLVKAVSTSNILAVNKETKQVARLTPFKEPKDVDKRTVYVECLPFGSDREWIRNVFECCGRIVYISLPRYKSTGDIKGFAFVEFEKVEDAKKACEMLNHPPAKASENMGCFPRSKQLIQLEKQVRNMDTAQGRKRRASESEIHLEMSQKTKRLRTVSEGKDEKVEMPLPTDSSSVQELPSAGKRKRTVNSKDTDVGELLELKSKNDQSVHDPKTDPEMVTEAVSKTSSKKIRTHLLAEETQTKTNLDSKVKGNIKKDEEKSRSKTTDEAKQVEEKPNSGKKRKKLEKSEVTSASADNKGILLKRKAEEYESEEKEIKRVKICENAEDLEMKQEPDEEGKKKRKGHKKKNKHKTNTKDIPELRVIPKQQWLKLRSEYLTLQKSNMNQLKAKLQEMKNTTDSIKKEEITTSHKVKTIKANSDCKTEPAGEPSSETADTASDLRKANEPKFSPGVIVKLTTDQPVTRKDVKEKVWFVGSIEYMDVKDFDTICHIRCSDQQTATSISQLNLPGYLFQLLSGDEEQKYWDKLISDRDKKLNTKTRIKRRGREKVLQKADTTYEKLHHVYYD